MKTEKQTKSYHLELHFKRPMFEDMTEITCSEDVDKCLRDNINLKRIDHKEFFWVILLTKANRVLGISKISSGKTDAAMINDKEIVQLIALSNATAVVLAHNHPSGKLKPSQSDESITDKAQTILNLIGVTLLDHLIITSEGYYSMVDNELLTHPNH